jgi:hypothetical protein
MRMSRLVSLALVVLAGFLLHLSSASARDAEPGQVPAASDQSSAVALVPGPLRGLGSMGPHGRTRFCDARAVGLAQWRSYALTQMLDLSKEQQAALADLSVVSAKALAMMSATCKGATDKSQLSAIQARLETLLDVLKTVRPAYEAFYAKLDDRQKVRLDSLGPRRSGWRW